MNAPEGYAGLTCHAYVPGLPLLTDTFTVETTLHTPGLLQADLDLGNYERFMDLTLTKDNNITTGKIYQVSSSWHMLTAHSRSLRRPRRFGAWLCCLSLRLALAAHGGSWSLIDAAAIVQLGSQHISKASSRFQVCGTVGTTATPTTHDRRAASA